MNCIIIEDEPAAQSILETTCRTATIYICFDRKQLLLKTKNRFGQVYVE